MGAVLAWVAIASLMLLAGLYSGYLAVVFRGWLL